jgi:hypothetical protein
MPSDNIVEGTTSEPSNSAGHVNTCAPVASTQLWPVWRVRSLKAAMLEANHPLAVQTSFPC